MNTEIKGVIAQIREIDKASLPVLIAIEGFGGSGKTTYAHELCKVLRDVEVIHMDDFIVKENISENSWDNGVFDRKRLETQVLLPLSRGEDTKYQRLIWDSNVLSDFVTISNRKYIIVEGITSYHPDIERYYDYKIWIHTPSSIATKRGIERDGGNTANWNIWKQNDLEYVKEYSPEKRADSIIDNFR